MGTAEWLTPQREQELVLAADAGDGEASRELVEAFLPAIAALAAHYPSATAVERQELVQEGVAGLLVAARRFDSRLNTRFWSYASFWVRKGMQELVAQVTGPVALSDRAVRALAELRLARRQHLEAHGAEPTADELSRATGFTRGQIERLQATERRPRALEEPVGGEAAATVGETIPDPGAEGEYEQVLDQIELRVVRDVTGELEERERRVIRAHYGLGEPVKTFDEIGEGLGLTAERARQIELSALKKLRSRL